ncbi:MAG: hypothetical protein PHP45_04320 [Elusimicrobiales bacterium]|nr:hypothetical protein [Elusimicrobiales bacterium]
MKKTIFCFSLLFLAASARAQQAGGLALLWVPAADCARTEIVDALQRSSNGFKLTVAVSPLAAPRAERQKLLALEAEGKAELALRIMGDPVLPVLFSPSSPLVLWRGKGDYPLWNDRMDEAASRLFFALEGYKKLFGKEPDGWVPAGGGVTPDFAPLLRAYGLKWTAAGRCGQTGGMVQLSSGTVFAPFEMVRDTADFSALLSSAAVSAAPVFGVIDETLAGPAAEALRGELAGLMESAAPPVRYMTVSQAINLAPSTEAASCFPPPWSGDYSPWAGGARQAGALLNLGAARKTFAIYRSSSQVKPPAVRQVEESFAELDTGDRFLHLAGTDAVSAEDAELDFKNSLENIYRLMGKAMPTSLIRPFAEAKVYDEQPQPDQSRTGKAANASITEGDGLLLLQNPEKTLQMPDTLSFQSKTADPSKFFNIEAVLVRWTPDTVEFRVKNSRSDELSRAEFERRFLADIYMDLNHRPRSGSTSLLEYRQLRASGEDAWELALTMTSEKARLFKATPQGPQLLGEYGVRVTKGGDITAEIPRAMMPGNPPLWGYLVLVLALQAAPGAGQVFKPLSSADASPIIDYLALDKIGSTFYFLRLPRKMQ